MRLNAVIQSMVDGTHTEVGFGNDQTYCLRFIYYRDISILQFQANIACLMFSVSFLGPIT